MAEEQTRRADADDMMATRKELEALHPTHLAVLCQNVADGADANTAEKARTLKAQWAVLQSPSSLSRKEEQAKDVARQELRKRMLDFLAERNLVDWIPKH